MSETSFSKQTASLAKTFMFRGFDPEEWARSLSAQSDGDKVRGVKNLYFFLNLRITSNGTYGHENRHYMFLISLINNSSDFDTTKRT